MLNINKMFPNDKILQNWIIDEFKDQKVIKMPEEYEINDSDE